MRVTPEDFTIRGFSPLMSHAVCVFAGAIFHQLATPACPPTPRLEPGRLYGVLAKAPPGATLPGASLIQSQPAPCLLGRHPVRLAWRTPRPVVEIPSGFGGEWSRIRRLAKEGRLAFRAEPATKDLAPCDEAAPKVTYGSR